MSRIQLPDTLDLSAAGELRSAIISHRGEDLTVDASEVQRLGGLCLQVLLAARQAWTLDGKDFRLVNISASCRDALNLAQAMTALAVEE